MAHVFISPLNWGLGHATRDLPIINEILGHGHHVTIGTTGPTLALLKKECPKCHFIDFPGYSATYSSSRFFLPKFVKDIPKMLKAFSNENKNVNKIFSREKYDLVVSDCRYGVYSAKIPSFLITHQITFHLPMVKLAEPVTELFNKYSFNHFRRVIVPDNVPPNNLCGKLCEPNFRKIKEKLYYAGILCSIKKMKIKEDLDYLFSISGPEPQRTKFEDIITKDVKNVRGDKVILLGKPHEDFERKLDKNTLVKSHASRDEMTKLMNRAKFIICRSGYTTMMELAELGKKHGLFMPTPGQPEQEYLSKYYMDKGWFYSTSQYKLDIVEDIEKTSDYKGFPVMSKSADNARRLYRELFAEHLD